MSEEKEMPETNGEESKESKEAGNGEGDIAQDEAIVRQIEYYFGDVNLPRDKFLREQVQLDEGWVPLDVLTRFNRLQKLTTDTEVIAKAIAKSQSALLEISEDNKKVRRNPELPVPEMNEERRKELSSRTIYAKGFPKDSILDDLLQFFKQFEVENVVMRKYQDRNTKNKLFKGSVFTLFKTREQAEKFISQKDIKYKESELLVLWQDDYIKQKQEEYANRKLNKDKSRGKKDDETKPEKEEFKLPTGSVLHFSEGGDKMSREHVKEALNNLGAEVAYIDFKLGDKEGWVRLAKENAAKQLSEKITDNKIKIGEAEVIFKLLEGDEEKAYLDKTIEEMTKRRKNQKNFKGKGRNNRGNNNWGNKHGNRKRKQDQHGDEPPKKIAAES